MKLLIQGKWHPKVDHLSSELTLEKFSKNIFSIEDSHSELPRFHLYVSYACPWAHRTLIYHKIKKLKSAVSISVVDPRWGGENGWYFKSPNNISTTNETTEDHLNHQEYLWQIYKLAKDDFTGRVTVPVLWDRHSQTIVSNESSEIIRFFDLQLFSTSPILYPHKLRNEIDLLNTQVLKDVCSRVYQVGFAKDQSAYEHHVQILFQTLQTLDERLKETPYLIGGTLTETDIHLFTALVRFDVVYSGALKCNLKPLTSFPNLVNYTQHLLKIPEFQDTTYFDHIKAHYYDQLDEINPKIIPLGPDIRYLTSNLKP